MLSITKTFVLSVAFVAALSLTSGAELQAGGGGGHGGGGHGWSGGGGHGWSGGHRSYSHSVVQNRHHYQAPQVHHAVQSYYTPQYAPVHHNRVQYNYHAPQAIQHGYQHVVRPQHYSTHRSGHYSH